MDIDAQLVDDPWLVINRHSVALDEQEDLHTPFIESLTMLIKQQRMRPISSQILDLRDNIFKYRGVYVLTVGQFANLWSYYDGFVRKAACSAHDDKIIFTCNWRACPATYAVTLLVYEQSVVIKAHQEHYHTVMDSVQQLPLCTLIRYQVLDALTSTTFSHTSVVLDTLMGIDKTLRLRAGLDRVSAGYVDELKMMLQPVGEPSERESEQERKIKRIRVS